MENNNETLNNLNDSEIKPRSNKKLLLVVGLAVIACVGISILIAVVFYLKNNDKPSSETPDNTDNSEQPSNLEKLKESFDYIYIDDGQLILASDDFSRSEQIIASDDPIMEYLHDKDRNKIYYTTYSSELLKKARDIATKRENLQDDENAPIATQMYVYDIESDKSELIIDFKDFDVNKIIDDASNQDLHFASVVAWRTNGINILALSPNNDKILYYRHGLFVYDIDKETEMKVAENMIGGACTPYRSDWSGSYFFVSYVCWEWLQTSLFELQGTNLREVDIQELELESHPGASKEISLFLEPGKGLINEANYDTLGTPKYFLYDLDMDNLEFGEKRATPNYVMLYFAEDKESLYGIVTEFDGQNSNYFIYSIVDNSDQKLVDLKEILQGGKNISTILTNNKKTIINEYSTKYENNVTTTTYGAHIYDHDTKKFIVIDFDTDKDNKQMGFFD